ncbi:glycine cleavage system protein H [Glycocaulis alkaliphilus]|uniref:Glycine cleavage system H protein n=1 Tax=Glycocaulis alkaliphilus TaxID=1434191 RepID=A0A3T0E930_9PROT|nr:glycine cleavage system protein GcvH [Glycocaulis alkaliphilus]AZU03706.1 glycine cleavage system protein H [Glycocaulis alkaliphilus]GGB83339.1 glycine cleavage system H protein [Glycocaulis alkaliphilus]
MTTRFTTDHEWVRLEGDVAFIGITQYATEQLGDVISVELPDVGKSFKKGDEIAVVDSVKTAAEVYAPVSGEVIEINDGIEDAPQIVNDEPQGGGWFVKLKIADKGELDGLMDEAAYAKHIG